MLNKKNKELDVPRLNEIIKISNHLLKIFYPLMIAGAILLITFVLNEWKVLSFAYRILQILKPLFIGLIIAWLFDPFVTWLSNKKTNRVLSTVITFLIVATIIYIFLSFFIPVLANQTNDFISFLPNILKYLQKFVDNIFYNIESVSGFNLEISKLEIYNFIENFGISIATKLPDTIIKILSIIFNGGITIGIGFMIGFYMLINFHNVRRQILGFIPKKWQNGSIYLTDKLNVTLRNFVHGTFTISIIVSIISSIGFMIAGLNAPVLFGLFAGFTNIIPYIGPYIGAIPAVIVGFSISPLAGIITLIVAVLVQMLDSIMLQPIIMGKTMKLHPVTIMIGLLIFGSFFGIIGMIVATPIISILKIVWNFINEKYSIIENITGNEE